MPIESYMAIYLYTIYNQGFAAERFSRSSRRLKKKRSATSICMRTLQDKSR